MASRLSNVEAFRGRDLFGQPKGLWVLAGTELWDRISFNGMQAMLVLYLTGDLLLDPARVRSITGFAAYRGFLESLTGPLSDLALATQTFGFYMTLATGLPLVGGWIGDRFMSRKLGVSLGAGAMTLGHFLMAFDATLLVALAFLTVGAGMLRGNLAPQIKSLYADGDPRETDAFQYYSMAILIGVFIAPIVTGGVAAIYGWHAGFGVAGVGMVIGLVTYLAGLRHLPPDEDREAQIVSRTNLTRSQRKRVTSLFLLLPVCILFWTAQTQVWNVYNVWVRDNIDMTVGGFTIPVPWMQSLDGLAPAIIIPLSLWLWASMAKRDRPVGSFSRMIVGLTAFGVATVLLSTGPVTAEGQGRGPIMLPVAFHVVSNLGFVWFHPTMVALFATRAPDTWRGTLLGFNSLAISAGSLVSGRMGALYETVSPHDFWLMNACLCFAGAAMLLATQGWFRRTLSRDADETGQSNLAIEAPA